MFEYKATIERLFEKFPLGLGGKQLHGQVTCATQPDGEPGVAHEQVKTGHLGGASPVEPIRQAQDTSEPGHQHPVRLGESLVLGMLALGE
jgi:hypothetical protein